MSGRLNREGGVALWAALGLLATLVALVPLFSPWLNGWTFFLFPLGTFILALAVPIALILLMIWIRRRWEPGA